MDRMTEKLDRERKSEQAGTRRRMPDRYRRRSDCRKRAAGLCIGRRGLASLSESRRRGRSMSERVALHCDRFQRGYSYRTGDTRAIAWLRPDREKQEIEFWEVL